MRNFNFSKMIIIALLIVIASFSAISLTAQSYRQGAAPNAVIKVVSDGTGGLDSIISWPGNFFKSKIQDFQAEMSANEQNQSLKQQLTDMKSEKQQLAALQQENQQLKVALKLQKTLTDYTMTNANVITRNPSNWNDMLVIDEGTDSGIKTNMIVMADGGIIGRISQANGATSKVELLTGSAGLVDKIPVQIGDSYGLLTSYDSSKGNYVVSYLTTSDSFAKNKSVVTSGLGGDSPSNLLLGKVVGQSGQSSDPNRKIYVKPAANFYNVQVVTVVKRQIEGN